MKIKNDSGTNQNPLTWIVLFGLFTVNGQLKAEELSVDPGDVVTPPTGVKIAALYSLNTKSNELYSNGKKVINNADFKTNVGLLRLGKNIDIDGIKVLPQLVIPYGRIDLGTDLGAQPARRQTGFGDPIIGATTWFITDPESKTWFGVPLYLTIPVGQYDAQHGSFNLGENRWKAIAQIGLAKGLADKFIVEVIAETSFYGKNNDFYGTTMKQDSTQSLMGHLTYLFNEKTTMSMSYFHTFGGETKVGGVDQNDSKNNNRWLATISRWVVPGVNVQLQYGQDIDVKNGLKQSDRFNLRLAKLF